LTGNSVTSPADKIGEDFVRGGTAGIINQKQRDLVAVRAALGTAGAPISRDASGPRHLKRIPAKALPPLEIDMV
jgi:hypothetical protein